MIGHVGSLCFFRASSEVLVGPTGLDSISQEGRHGS